MTKHEAIDIFQQLVSHENLRILNTQETLSCIEAIRVLRNEIQEQDKADISSREG